MHMNASFLLPPLLQPQPLVLFYYLQGDGQRSSLQACCQGVQRVQISSGQAQMGPMLSKVACPNPETKSFIVFKRHMHVPTVYMQQTRRFNGRKVYFDTNVQIMYRYIFIKPHLTIT